MKATLNLTLMSKRVIANCKKFNYLLVQEEFSEYSFRYWKDTQPRVDDPINNCQISGLVTLITDFKHYQKYRLN